MFSEIKSIENIECESEKLILLVFPQVTMSLHYTARHSTSTSGHQEQYPSYLGPWLPMGTLSGSVPGGWNRRRRRRIERGKGKR